MTRVSDASRDHSPMRWRTAITGNRAVRDGLSLVGLLVAFAVADAAVSDGFAFDAHAYWLASGYGLAPKSQDAFLYSPPILLAFRVLHELPWPVFLQVYTAAIAVGAWILAGPWLTVLIWTPQVASEITMANIHVFLALVAVFGLRWPALWSFALLTKVTPAVGLLWFVARGEWHKLLVALSATAAIALPTVILAPDLWVGWLTLLRGGSGEGWTLPLRLAIAAALVVLGARRDWPWMVPVAATLALPILWSSHGPSMLLGVVWWMRHRTVSWMPRRSAG